MSNIHIENVKPDVFDVGTGKFLYKKPEEPTEKRPPFLDEIDGMVKGGEPVENIHGAIDKHPQIQNKEQLKKYASAAAKHFLSTSKNKGQADKMKSNAGPTNA